MNVRSAGGVLEFALTGCRFAADIHQARADGSRDSEFSRPAPGTVLTSRQRTDVSAQYSFAWQLSAGGFSQISA